MTQDSILLIFKFPEDDSEVFMTYASDEAAVAEQDATNFFDAYPGVQYLYIVYVLDGREEELFRWTNPYAAKLISLANPAGLALHAPLTTSGFATSAGTYFQRLKKSSLPSAFALRPPLEGAYASPLPSTSKVYGGRNRRTRRGR